MKFTEYTGENPQFESGKHGTRFYVADRARRKVIDWYSDRNDADAEANRLNNLKAPRRLPPCDEVPF